jgi:hypothetical protein
MPYPTLVKSEPLTLDASSTGTPGAPQMRRVFGGQDAPAPVAQAPSTPTLVKSEPLSGGSQHPWLAAAARLAGGVGSAIAQPAEATGIGAVLPAGIAGAGESLAEWLEGSEQDPKRIATEAALGAVPLGWISKGRMLAGMAKSGIMGAVGEGARELARDEDLSPTSIGVSGGVNALTFGALSKLFGSHAPTPGGPKIAEPPLIESNPVTGQKTFRVPASAVKEQPRPMSGAGQTAVQNDIRSGLGKLLGAEESKLGTPGDLDSGIRDASVQAGKNRASNYRAGVTAERSEQTADLQRIKELLGVKAKEEAAQTKQAAAQKIIKELEARGYAPNDPNFTASESGVTPAGTTFRKSTSFSPPDEADEVVDDLAGGVPPSRTPAPTVPPEPTTLAQEPLAPVAQGEPSPVVPEPVQEPPSRPDAPFSIFHGDMEPGVHPQAPWGGAVLPDLRNTFLTTAQDLVDKGNAGNAAAGAGQAAGQAAGEAAGPAASAAAEAPETALAKFFRTRKGATGANLRQARAAANAGEIPTDEFARDSHLLELGKAPEGPFATSLPPARKPSELMDQLQQMLGDKGDAGRVIDEGATAPIAGGTTEPLPTGNPDAGAALADDAPDWVKQQAAAADALAAMKKDPGQQGSVSPALLKALGLPIAGAATGAVAGPMLDPDDPDAAVKGALAGGALGYGVGHGGQELINMRNAGLLATPSAQLKKPLSDAGAYIQKAAESAFSGKRDEAVAMLKEMFNPVNFSNYGRAFKNPALAEDVIGDTAKPYIEPAKGLMGLVARPFAAAQYATSQAMQRAGVTPEEAKNVLLLGKPETQLAQRWLDLQKLPGWQGQAVRAVRPFARIGTNIFERGFQRIPGVSMLTGDPETKVARTILGAGALGAGALTGAGDSDNEEQGGEPTSPLVQGLRRALMASYGVPFVLGESLTGPHGIRDLYYMTPGTSQTLPAPAPKDTIFSYGKKFGKRWLDQMMPDWANPLPEVERTQR